MSSISVIIPVFNRAHSVGLAIDSALAQSCDGDQVSVTVVDDGSHDDLAAALKPYGDRVTLLRHAKNAGAAAARNTGVANSNADYVAFLDSDDTWLPGKIAKQLADIRRNKWRASCTAFYLHRENYREGISPKQASGPLGLSDLVWGCYVSPGSTLMFERSVFEGVGPLDQKLGRLEDWDWLLRYTRQHKLGFLAEPLARIEVSLHRNSGVVVAAIDAMRVKHSQNLDEIMSRNFAAALDFEASAAYYRAGEYGSALVALAKSLRCSVLGNKALGAVLHNKFSGMAW
jgi:glycosyltransferase involved in cell wall biosynthesis